MPNVPNIQPDPLLPEYRYNAAAGRYIGSNGQFIGQQTIRGELDNVLDSLTDRLVLLSRDFRSGGIDGRSFQTESMRLIKQVHLAAGAMEKGGWFNMTQSDFGRIGQIVRSEYSYFSNMIQQIENGTQRLDGTLDNRLRLYGQAGRGTYHKLEREDRAGQGYDQERSILHGRDHCRTGIREGCIEQAALGWQPIGEMVPIGSRTCLSNDKCSVSYRNSKTGEII